MSKSLAIAYSMKKKASKGHQSGCTENCESPCKVHEGDEKRPNEMAEGGKVGELKGINKQEWEDHKPGVSEAGRKLRDENPEEAKSLHYKTLGQLKAQKTGYFSKGGMVANEAKSNRDTDFLATDDDLEFNYTGKNSGDELSSPGEDDRRKDVVSKAMARRKKKD